MVTMFIISFCYFHVKNVYAVTYDFETSFEESDPFGNWTEDPVEGYGYEIQTDIVHSGVNACRTTLDSGSMTYELDSNQSAHYMLVYFYINGSVPDGYGGDLFIRIWDPEITVYIETNASRGAGKSPYVKFYDQMDDDFNVLDSEGLALETWHTVQIYTEGDSASANHKCWVNGRLIADVSDDTSGFNITKMTLENVYWTGDYDGRVFVDDFRSNNEVPHYYFSFNFYDLDSEDVEEYVDWALWNSTHDIGYTEGEATLEFGTYTLKTSKYGHLINTTTLDTDTYGNSTVSIHLNMKRHQSCPNGFIVSNETISTVSIHEETPQLLNFTIDGTTPALLGVGVSKNASHIEETIFGSEIWLNQSLGNKQIDCRDGKHKGQQITISEETISKVAFYLSKWGNPTGTVYSMIRKAGNDEIIETSTDTLDFSTIPSYPNFAWFNFSFNSFVNEQVRIIVTYADGNSGNYLMVKYQNTDVCSGCYTQFNLDEWIIDTSLDCTIRIYKKGAGMPVNMTDWKYHSSPSHIEFNRSSFTTFAFHFPASDSPVVGPNPNPAKHRLWVNVMLNGEKLKGCNVTVEGGPDNIFEWGLTDLFGRAKFSVKKGPYEVVATYDLYRKTVQILVSKATDITIDLTEADYFPDGFPEDQKGPEWFSLPELDLSNEAILFLLLPLIVLIIYAVKKASEGPKRKWKYSYLD